MQSFPSQRKVAQRQGLGKSHAGPPWATIKLIVILSEGACPSRRTPRILPHTMPRQSIFSIGSFAAHTTNPWLASGGKPKVIFSGGAEPALSDRRESNGPLGLH